MAVSDANECMSVRVPKLLQEGGSMIPVLIETVLHCLFVSLTVAVCLRAARMRNDFARKTGPSLAPSRSLASPSLLPIAERLHFQSVNSSVVRPAYSMSLLQELQEMLQARSGSGLLPRHFEAPASITASPQSENASRPISSAPGPGENPLARSRTEPASGPSEPVSNNVTADQTQSAPQCRVKH